MPIKVQFNGQKFDQIEGYRISLCMTPGAGIGGHFYVYIWDRMDAMQKPTGIVDMGEEGPRTRGKLEISGVKRTYTFEDIDLNCAQMGVTRRERFRLLEFNYAKEIIDGANDVVSLSNETPDRLKKGGLADDYKYLVEGDSDHLLEFNTRLSASEANVLRFSALRRSGNSFLEKLVSVNGEQVKNSEIMPSFNIGLGDQTVEVTHDNLKRAFVEESYGELRRIHARALSDYLGQAAEAMGGELARTSLASHSAQELLAHDAEAAFKTSVVDPQTVETATFVFQTGVYRDLKVK